MSAMSPAAGSCTSMPTPKLRVRRVDRDLLPCGGRVGDEHAADAPLVVEPEVAPERLRRVVVSDRGRGSRAEARGAGEAGRVDQAGEVRRAVRSRCRPALALATPSARYAGARTCASSSGCLRVCAGGQPTRVELRPRLDRGVGERRLDVRVRVRVRADQDQLLRHRGARDLLVQVRAAPGERDGAVLLGDDRRAADDRGDRELEPRRFAAAVVFARRADQAAGSESRAVDEPPQAESDERHERERSEAHARRRSLEVNRERLPRARARRSRGARRRTRPRSATSRSGRRRRCRESGAGASRRTPQSIRGQDDVVGDQRDSEACGRKPHRTLGLRRAHGSLRAEAGARGRSPRRRLRGRGRGGRGPTRGRAARRARRCAGRRAGRSARRRRRTPPSRPSRAGRPSAEPAAGRPRSRRRPARPRPRAGCGGGTRAAGSRRSDAARARRRCGVAGRRPPSRAPSRSRARRARARAPTARPVGRARARARLYAPRAGGCARPASATRRGAAGRARRRRVRARATGCAATATVG